MNAGLPAWCLGTGVGSCGFSMGHTTEFAEWLPLLRRFESVGVRGPLSPRTLLRAGIDQAQVVGDLGLALTRDETLPAADPPRFLVDLALRDRESMGRESTVTSPSWKRYSGYEQRRTHSPRHSN